VNMLQLVLQNLRWRFWEYITNWKSGLGFIEELQKWED
jgi:hypothetical protein